MPLVAIIGRPNVGKSTLFNRLTGSRKSIVGDEPGITRDRIYGEVEWRSKRFELVDTGGIVPDDEAIIPANIFKQAGFAIEKAEAIIWVVDARAGITPLDEEIAVLLRALSKPIFIAANKAESQKVEDEAGEFYRFGFDLAPVSSEHGTGIGELLDQIFETLEIEDDVEEAPASNEIKLAIIGRPNVGKSSLLNQLLGEERVIVSPIAGTTRDSIDTNLTVDGRDFVLIDTAGIRRKGKTTEMAEKMSVVMARKSLERADVAVLIIDAVEGVTNLDANIAGYAVDSGCSVIIAVNKWDALEEKETNTIYQFEDKLRQAMKFLEWAPMVTISALSGQRVQNILPLVIKAYDARNVRVPTAQLNKFFEENISQPKGGSAPAPVKGGVSRLRVKYITQGGMRPPLFVLFTAGGSKGGLHFSYLRYVENRLRDEFGFYATPIRIKERRKAGASN
ncbi:MAG: ribosome biogenesis GTPase Der [Acidobacteria bacterium]|nr:MAG: ribosome biogenesis GTPase Der [Acidobacteriota bacterium]